MKLLKMSLVAALFASSTLLAEETSGVEISANVALTSNYVWRGMTQSQDSPAIQGGFDLSYEGIYAGVWGSNVNYGSNVSLEADFYAGYANEIAGFGYDLGYIQYVYPNDSDASNFGEAYLALSYDFKVLSVGASYALGVETNDLDPDNNWDVSMSVPLPMDFSIDGTYGDYDTLGAYYLVGVNKSFGKFDFTVAYTANDGGDAGSDFDQDNVVATIAASF